MGPDLNQVFQQTSFKNLRLLLDLSSSTLIVNLKKYGKHVKLCLPQTTQSTEETYILELIAVSMTRLTLSFSNFYTHVHAIKYVFYSSISTCKVFCPVRALNIGRYCTRSNLWFTCSPVTTHKPILPSITNKYETTLTILGSLACTLVVSHQHETIMRSTWILGLSYDKG